MKTRAAQINNRSIRNSCKPANFQVFCGTSVVTRTDFLAPILIDTIDDGLATNGQSQQARYRQRDGHDVKSLVNSETCN